MQDREDGMKALLRFSHLLLAGGRCQIPFFQNAFQPRSCTPQTSAWEYIIKKWDKAKGRAKYVPNRGNKARFETTFFDNLATWGSGEGLASSRFLVKSQWGRRTERERAHIFRSGLRDLVTTPFLNSKCSVTAQILCEIFFCSLKRSSPGCHCGPTSSIRLTCAL